MVPISLLTPMIETSVVSESIAFLKSLTLTLPSLSTGSRVTRQPKFSKAVKLLATEACSTLEVMICLPNSRF